MSNKFVRVIVLVVLAEALIVGALMLYSVPVAHAAPNVTITQITPFLTQDSNNSCAAGPKAIFLQVDVKNISASPLTNLSASISSFAGTAGVTLASGESATRYIGTLAASATAHLFWYINYPCQAGSNPPPLTSTYTVAVTDNSGPTTSGTLTLTTRSEISASAGGDVFSTILGPGIFLGEIIPYTVTFSFGNAAAGSDMMMQPAGNASFSAGCFQLVSDDITASVFTTPSTSDDNKLYFASVTGPGGSDNRITVVYYFKVLCVNGTTTTINPFSDIVSGGAEKYTGNFGTCTTTSQCDTSIQPPSNPFQISKSVSAPSVSGGGSLIYTVIITNTSSLPALIDVVTDTLPIGPSAVTYGVLQAASFVQAANSSAIPSTGATGTVKWVSLPNSTYSVPGNGSITVIYSASWPAGAQNGNYQNTVTARSGNVEIGPRSVIVAVGSPTAVVLSSFAARFDGTEASPRATLFWTTASEINTAGFEIYRSEQLEGPYSRINAQLIPASQDQVAGASYQFTDGAITPGKTFYYQLEDVEFGGASTRHPPIEVLEPAFDLNPSASAFAGLGVSALLIVGAGGYFMRRHRKHRA